MLRLIIFIFCLFVIGRCEERQSRLVSLSQGLVKGYKDLEEDIYVFYSIPYATTPTGLDRFKAPLLPPVWTGTFEAVDKEIICPQNNIFGLIGDSKLMQEDCLIANIYVPETDQDNLPVVVYIHGGAYTMGWGDMLTPKQLVSSKKVIAITFNYRLGVLGFLCLGTKDVPGNAGMKDQVALLRWVKENIKHFGGNPDEVTIAGYSAGSSSVDLLPLSKITDGLFKRLIPESGANTAIFSIQTNPIKNAKEYAKLLNFENVDDINDLEHFFKTTPYEEFYSVNTLDEIDSNILMVPCVESDLGVERFLEKSPVNILKSGDYKKLPMLYGFANMEGLIRLPLFDIWKDQMNKKFSDFLPANLNFKDETEKEQVAKRVKSFYFSNEIIENEDILSFIDYFTDIIFSYPALQSVKYQVEAGNNQIYLYEYSFSSDDTPVIPYTNVRGATHCAQTYTVLDGYFNGTVINEKEVPNDMKEMKSLMREIWLNFMISGKPIAQSFKMPVWEPVRGDWSPHMSINKTIQLKESLLKERTLFWDAIYERYYSTPVEPRPLVVHSEL